MIHNKLQLNDDKPELVLATPREFHNHPSLPASMRINQVDISFSPSVRSLGVVLDQTLSFKKHVSRISTVAYLELRRISTNSHYLFVDAVKTLTCAIFLSRVVYCNSPLAGIPKCLLDSKQFRITLHALSSNILSIAMFPSSSLTALASHHQENRL